MMDYRAAIQGLRDRLATIISRGKLALAGYSPTKARTMVQLSGLAGGTLQNIELLLPYGRSALPSGNTADLLILKINSLDHKVALCADDPALRITDLQSGEFGDRDARGQQIVYRLGWLELTTPNFVKLASGAAPGSNPPSGSYYLYVDPADSKLKARGSGGTISILASP